MDSPIRFPVRGAASTDQGQMPRTAAPDLDRSCLSFTLVWGDNMSRKEWIKLLFRKEKVDTCIYLPACWFCISSSFLF